MARGPKSLLDGDRLLSQGKYTQAIEKLKIAVELLPRHPQAWNRLGMAYQGAGQYADAIQAYKHSLQLDPNLPAVRYNLGCLYLDQNQLPAALSELNTFTVLARTSPEGWLKLGTAQLRSHQLDAAENTFRQTLALNKSLPEAYNGIGIIQVQRNRVRDAVNYFNTALQKQRDYGPALLNLAIIQQQSFNNKPLALQLYRDYLKTAPPPEMANSVQRVIQGLEYELNPPPKVTVNPETNTLPARPPAPQQTATNITLVVTSAPPAIIPSTNPPRRVSLAPAVIPESKSNVVRPPPEAVKIEPQPPSQNVAAQPKPAPVTNSPPVKPIIEPVQEPRVVSVTNEPPIKVAHKEEPAAPEAATNSAPEKIASSVPANSSNPKSEKAPVSDLVHKITPRESGSGLVDKLNPLHWFRDKKQDQTAADVPRPASNPNQRPSLPPVGSPGVQDAKPSKTEPTPNNIAFNSRSSTPVPIPNFVRYTYRQGKPAPGDRSKANPLFAQALKAHQESRLVEAMESYREALKLDPSFFEANYNLGLVAYEMRDLSQSLSAYDTALSINPTSTDARYNFALALDKANYALDAVNELERLLADHPEIAKAQFALARLYSERLYQPETARPHYQKVLELEPNHPQATAIRFWLAAHP